MPSTETYLIAIQSIPCSSSVMVWVTVNATKSPSVASTLTGDISGVATSSKSSMTKRSTWQSADGLAVGSALGKELVGFPIGTCAAVIEDGLKVGLTVG